jgi:hypothetical protein
VDAVAASRGQRQVAQKVLFDPRVRHGASPPPYPGDCRRVDPRGRKEPFASRFALMVQTLMGPWFQSPQITYEVHKPNDSDSSSETIEMYFFRPAPNFPLARRWVRDHNADA